MSFFALFRKKRVEDDGIAMLLKAAAEQGAAMRKNAVDADELPTGYGEFGLEVTNPIPTNRAAGSNQYLSMLRTIAGEPVEFSRIGSTGAPKEVTEAMVDIYTVGPAGGPQTRLFVSCYHKRNSRRAPKGFVLAK